MKSIQKVNIVLKDDQVLVTPLKPVRKSDHEEVSRVRICCVHDEYPVAFFYMGKGASLDSWIPESIPPDHITPQMLVRIAWELRESYSE